MTKYISAIIALFLVSPVLNASEPAKLDRRIDAATEVLQQINRIPEQAIPPSLLKRAYGVVVIPNVVKAGFIVGASYGKGLLVVRQPDGRWSNPTFVTIGGASIGWQIGAQATDIILVFKSRKGLDSIANGKLTLGADAAVAAGPVGRYASAGTDLRLKSEIYSYSRSRGLFAGVSLEGAVLSIDKKANFAYYSSGQVSIEGILRDTTIPTPTQARYFIDVLTATAPSLQWQTQPNRAAAASDVKTGDVQTYAIEDGTQPRDEAVF